MTVESATHPIMSARERSTRSATSAARSAPRSGNDDVVATTPDRRQPGARSERLSSEQREMVERNIPLVEHIVTRMTTRYPSNYSRDDLVQTGLIGLIEASTRFDPSMGVAFSTFAGRRIEGAVIDMLRRDDWAPRSVRALERRVEAAEQALISEVRRVPSPTELGSAVGVPEDVLRRLRDDINRASLDSLDRMVNPMDGDRSLGENLADLMSLSIDEELDLRELKGFVRDAISLLPEGHRLVVVGYFLEGRSMTELGAFLGITQSRASQIKEESLTILRNAINAQYAEKLEEPTGLKARRQAAFSALVANASTWRQRLEPGPIAEPADLVR